MKKTKLKLERVTVHQMSRADLAHVNGGSAAITCVTCGCPPPGSQVLRCQPTLLCPIGTIGC